MREPAWWRYWELSLARELRASVTRPRVKKRLLPDPSPDGLEKFHFIMMIVWGGPLAALSVFVLKDSLLWVIIMSVYACFIGHFASWDAARAEKQNNEEKNE